MVVLARSFGIQVFAETEVNNSMGPCTPVIFRLCARHLQTFLLAPPIVLQLLPKSHYAPSDSIFDASTIALCAMELHHPGFASVNEHSTNRSQNRHASQGHHQVGSMV